MDWHETLLSPLTFLVSAEKRTYWLYLLSSFLIAYWISGTQLFKLKLWFNASSVVDVIWLFINQWLFKLLVLPLMALQVSYALSVNQWLVQAFGHGNFWKIDQALLMLLFSFSLFLVQDFFKFLVHFSFHKLPFLWRFHAVHHSATNMTPLTLYRIHPVEMCINAARSLIVGASVTGLFLYAFQNSLAVSQIIGVNVFIFAFNLCASNLRHSPVWLGFSKLEHLFISPAQHQIHHSVQPKHYDKNFGSALAIWDKLFGCHVLSEGQQVTGFGLDQSLVNRQTVKQQWWGIGQ
ncbi:sterol desaturase [Vibrio genomosp. F10 str. ZF-129]|uniref:Sterol desaturase n=1 Tax=Vibrio genomosp. F10 str. ZF-129 TaxID=1187848 RepID=A0A1E5BKC2_9VIBR|nr:sterol desaturase family protein [Vibrio genomosp. F10]OEE38076.1 sterol desaturase [Vibrio genomosp. F10 str. ZF-129]